MGRNGADDTETARPRTAHGGSAVGFVGGLAATIVPLPLMKPNLAGRESPVHVTPK